MNNQDNPLPDWQELGFESEAAMQAFIDASPMADVSPAHALPEKAPADWLLQNYRRSREGLPPLPYPDRAAYKPLPRGLEYERMSNADKSPEALDLASMLIEENPKIRTFEQAYWIAHDRLHGDPSPKTREGFSDHDILDARKPSAPTEWPRNSDGSLDVALMRSQRYAKIVRGIVDENDMNTPPEGSQEWQDAHPNVPRKYVVGITHCLNCDSLLTDKGRGNGHPYQKYCDARCKRAFMFQVNKERLWLTKRTPEQKLLDDLSDAIERDFMGSMHDPDTAHEHLYDRKAMADGIGDHLKMSRVQRQNLWFYIRDHALRQFRLKHATPTPDTPHLDKFNNIGRDVSFDR